MFQTGLAKRHFLLPHIVLLVTMAAAFLDMDDDKLDSDCYTVNGADYAGNQSYITVGDVDTTCLPWNMSGHDEFAHLPMNYCRNPNGSVFPWCFVYGANGVPEMHLCDIERCSTPAYLGCFMLPDESNHTVVKKNDEKMKISKCLKFCRDQRFDLAGLFQGRSCRCLTDEEELNDDQVTATRCLHHHCGGDVIHACGGDDVIAVYDTTAGMCGGVFYQQSEGIIYSPRWPGPYQHNMTCDWSVHVPSKLLDQRDFLQLTLEFVHFDLQPDTDLLSIHSLDAVTSPSPETYAIYHGNHVPPGRKLRMSLRHIRSVILHFESDHSIEHFGFTVLFSIVNATSSDNETSVEIFQQSHFNAELTTEMNNNKTNNATTDDEGDEEEPIYMIHLNDQQYEENNSQDDVVEDKEDLEENDVTAETTNLIPSSLQPDVTSSTLLTEVGSGNDDAAKGKIPGNKSHQTLGVMIGSAFCASLLLVFAILLMYELVRRKRKHQQLTTGLELQQQQQQQQNFNNPIQMIS